LTSRLGFDIIGVACRSTNYGVKWKIPGEANDFDQDLHLGAFGKSKSRYFDGLIGEVRIHMQALKVEDMMTLKDGFVNKLNVNMSAFGQCLYIVNPFFILNEGGLL